jgi:hypothetical protein
MADPFTIAQTGVDPTTGSYLSSERRKAIFRSTRVSGFGGGGGGATERGGAIVVRPQTNLVDRAQNLQIQQTQQSVSAIQPILDVVRVNVRDLGTNINNLLKSIQGESAIEQKNIKDQQEAERKLNERKIREGRENLLERRIAGALAKPIINLQQKIGGLFERIMGAMTTLFFGWLTNQGIETLKAYTSGNTKRLEEIKNSLIKNLLFSLGAFAAINLGFGLLMRTITGLTLRIAGMAARIVLAPFRAAGGALARIFGGGARAGSAAANAARAGAGARPLITGDVNLMTRMSNIGRGGGLLRGAGNFLKGGGRLIPGFNIVAGGLGTAYDLSRGDYGGAALSAASMLPFVGTPAAIARLGLEGYRMTQKDKPQTPTAVSGKPTPTPAPPAAAPAATTPAPAVVQPQTPAISTVPMQFNVDQNNTFSVSSQSLLQSASPGTPNLESYQQGMQGASPASYSTANIQAPPKEQTPIGTLPEAKPNIILTGGQSKAPTPQSSASSGPISDVPLISPGNTDNFYVLYSQLNYNVVM